MSDPIADPAALAPLLLVLAAAALPPAFAFLARRRHRPPRADMVPRSTEPPPAKPASMRPAILAIALIAVLGGAALWASVTVLTIGGGLGALSRSVDQQARAQQQLAGDLHELAAIAKGQPRADGRVGGANPAPPSGPGAWTAIGLVFLVAVGVALAVAWPRLSDGERVRAATGLASVGALVGALSLIKDMNLDFTLLKEVSMEQPSLMHVSFDFGKQMTTTTARAPAPNPSPPPAAIHSVCDGREIGPFIVGSPFGLMGDQPATRKSPGARLRAAVAKLEAEMSQSHRGVLLLGSTDARAYRNGGDRNVDLATQRANEVAILMPQMRRGRSAAGLDPIVLNDVAQGGVARVVVGRNERASSRSVLVCSYWRDAPP